MCRMEVIWKRSLRTTELIDALCTRTESGEPLCTDLLLKNCLAVGVVSPDDKDAVLSASVCACAAIFIVSPGMYDAGTPFTFTSEMSLLLSVSSCCDSQMLSKYTSAAKDEAEKYILSICANLSSAIPPVDLLYVNPAASDTNGNVASVQLLSVRVMPFLV